MLAFSYFNPNEVKCCKDSLQNEAPLATALKPLKCFCSPDPKLHYCKVPKFWDARNLFCNLPKIQTKGPNPKGILSKW